MQGPEAMRSALTAHLAERVPARLAAIEDRLGLTTGELPMPQIFEPTESRLVPFEQWPFYMVVMRDARSFGHIDSGAFQSEYVVTYAFRVYTFARGDGFEEAGRARDRYQLAVRETLLHRRSLVGAGGAAVQAIVHDDTFRESYSEINPVLDASRSVGAAYLEGDVSWTETLST